MTSESIQVLLLAVVISVIAPLVLSWMTNRNIRSMKQLDWNRQDAVAEQVKLAATALIESNRNAEVNSLKVQGQLTAIHTLVNSNLTASLQGELNSTIRELAGLREIVVLTKAAGRDAAAETLAAIALADSKIAELQTTLIDRKHQQTVVDASLQKTTDVVANVNASAAVTASLGKIESNTAAIALNTEKGAPVLSDPDKAKRIADAEAALEAARKS